MQFAPSKKFQENWHMLYPDISPIGWRLKSVLSGYWFRIHSLPNAKRYAETETELNELLQRQYLIIQDLMIDSPCLQVYFFLKTYINRPDISSYSKKTIYYEFQFIDHEDEETYDFYSSDFDLEKDMNSILLKDVANDRLDGVYFLNLKNGNIFAPYDGGADLIVKDPTLRDRLKSKYKPWLSQHPNGL